MTATGPAVAVQRRRGRPPHHDWGRAFRALRRLFADNEDTSQVFEVMRALNGDSHIHGYARLLSTDDGGRVAYERVELGERLMEDAWRATFPPGSVGAAYVEFIESQHLSAAGLIEESHKGLPDPELDPRHPYAWFGRRIRDIHDIWHVLTGYGRDALGEICLVTFSYQETHGLGWALISSGAFLRAHGPAAKQARKAIVEARRLGERAKIWLPGEDYERLLLEPLDAARRRIGLTPPTAYEAVSAADRHLALT